MDWKYQIGDFVVPIALLKEAECRARVEHALSWYFLLRVRERHAVECVAGIQRYYMVEGISRVEQYAEESLVSDSAYYEQQVALYEKILAAKKAV